jgi:hypothetical protein
MILLFSSKGVVSGFLAESRTAFGSRLPAISLRPRFVIFSAPAETSLPLI